MSARDPLSEEQREIRELVRTLARERIAPRAAEIDKSAEFPWDVVELYRENGLFGLMFDEEHGGVGASALMTLVVIEEVSRVCATSGLILAVQELASITNFIFCDASIQNKNCACCSTCCVANLTTKRRFAL